MRSSCEEAELSAKPDALGFGGVGDARGREIPNLCNNYRPLGGCFRT